MSAPSLNHIEAKILLSDLIAAGNTAVVTGASSGIGRAAVLHFAQAGMHIWMVDVDEKELKQTHAVVEQVIQARKSVDDKAPDQVAHAEVVDVSDYKAVQALAAKVFDHGSGKCHILMNNAGTGLGGGSLTDMWTVNKVMGVNTYGPIHGCLAFVPLMKGSFEPGIIINTGSKQGITMPPGNLTYNMSKAALKCYTEGLEHELMQERMHSRGKLRAVLLVPGWVNTSILLKSERLKASGKKQAFDASKIFFHEAKPQPGAWMPSQVIEYMISEVDKGLFYVICPDNDVDTETDNARMTWAMQDITERRPPLSRWHPEYKEKFDEFLKNWMESKKQT